MIEFEAIQEALNYQTVLTDVSINERKYLIDVCEIIVEISVFSNFWHVVGHLRVKLKWVQQWPRMSAEFDSKKDLHTVKFEQRPKFYDSGLSGLRPFDNMVISVS